MIQAKNLEKARVISMAVVVMSGLSMRKWAALLKNLKNVKNSCLKTKQLNQFMQSVNWSNTEDWIRHVHADTVRKNIYVINVAPRNRELGKFLKQTSQAFQRYE